MAEHLRGMFAVAVWDRDKREGVLIRDRLGVKPLYYALVDGLVVFGSELKCVLASGAVPAELDPEAIAAFLTLGYVPGADDAAASTSASSRPASASSWPAAGRRVERWWSLPRPAARPRGAQTRTSGRRSCSRSSTSRCGCG